jgi:nucleotide-binding universal stress UspA family protein
MQRMERAPQTGGAHFRNVVVGVDEKQGGRDAIALAEKLMATGGSMTCVRVLVRDPLVGRGSETDTRAIDHDQVRLIEAPSVGQGLHELAEAERADLLVIGSCQRGLLGRVVIGDETSEALNGATCAVAIAPFGYADVQAEIGPIGVAYDGSPEGAAALSVGRELARQHDARLSAFQAVAVPAYLSMPGAGGLTLSGSEMVDDARARIAALGDVEPHASFGIASEELAVYSASLGLLLIGSRGYGPVGRLVHGSTSRQLARTSRCPLLVLTRDSGSRLPSTSGARPAVTAVS